MKIRKRIKFVTMMLVLTIMLAIMPAKPAVAQVPGLIPSIDIHFSETVFVTLTNVYEFYVPFGYRMSIYMGEGGTIRFNGINGPYSHELGTILYEGRTFDINDIQPEGCGAASFNLGWCSAISGFVFPDYMELVGGTYQWVAQLMINQYIDFQAHTDALAQYGRYSLFRHTWQKDTQVFENVPRIAGITIRPPGIFEDDDLTITFTNVYDHIGRADIMTQSMIWFYLSPNGSFSLNRDVELTSMFNDGEKFETIHLAAGEAFNMYGHSSVSFHYGDFEIDCCHAYGVDDFYKQHTIAFRVPDQNRMPILSDFPPARVSYHAVNSAARTLRFVIDSITYTDNGESRTLDAAPFIAYDRTMVPLRVIGEALGATDMDFDDGIITFNIDGLDFIMTIGQQLAGNMGVPVIVADRTFVPLAFIVTELGAEVYWDIEARAAYVFIN